MPRARPDWGMIETGVYKHYKGGLYNVFGVAMDQSLEGHVEPLVLYSPVGSVHSEVDFHVRLLSEFLDHIFDPDKPEERIQRFRKL